MELSLTFEEMPLLIGGHSVGMFDGRCIIRIDGTYPIVEWFAVQDTLGRMVSFADLPTHQMFASAIIAHFEREIADARRELDEQDDPPEYSYGRLHPAEIR